MTKQEAVSLKAENECLVISHHLKSIINSLHVHCWPVLLKGYVIEYTVLLYDCTISTTSSAKLDSFFSVLVHSFFCITHVELVY